MKGIKMNKQKDKDNNNDNKNKEKNKKKYIDTIILDAIKNVFKKDTIKNIFKNDKIVFLTNIVTYIMFAIIVYLMQNSIVQEIKLGQRNNTCKQAYKLILTTYDYSNPSIWINTIFR